MRERWVLELIKEGIHGEANREGEQQENRCVDTTDFDPFDLRCCSVALHLSQDSGSTEKAFYKGKQERFLAASYLDGIDDQDEYDDDKGGHGEDE